MFRPGAQQLKTSEEMWGKMSSVGSEMSQKTENSGTFNESRTSFQNLTYFDADEFFLFS